MDFGTVFVEFRSNVDKFTRELRQVGFQLNVMESLAKNQEQVWRAVATTAFYFSRKMTDGMLGLAEAAGEVDQKMAGMRTVLKATDAEFENLKNTAREWSNEHITSVNDLLEASYNMASAGLNISQVMATMKNASILAAGAYGTMEQATSLLTNAMNVFGKTMPSYISDMSKADEMTNVFAYTVQKFKIILPQLESGMARIAGVASAFGFDMSEAAIALGALTTAGLSAEQAGTAIKNFYERSAKAAKEMGLQVFDSSGKIRGLYDLLGDIKQYYGGAIDSAEEFAHAQGIFTTRGSQVITILQGISEELRNNSIEAKNSATATELAAEVEQGFSAQMTILSNNLNNLKVAFGEGLTVTIKLVADGLGALYSILQAMPGWIQAVISTFLLFSSVAITVVAGVAMIRKSFGALISQIKTLLLSVPILGTVLKAAFSPVGLGIMAAVTAISIVIDLISKQKEETIKVNEEIAKQAKEVVNLYTTYKASENAMKNNTKFAEEFLSVQKELEKYLPESSKTKIAAVKIDGSDEEILKAISEELDKIGEKSRELTKNTLEIEIAGEWDKLIKTNEELNKMKVIKNEIGDLEARYNEIVQARSNLPEGYTTERFEAAAQIGNKINELDDTFKKLGLTIIDSKGKLKEYDLIAAELAVAFNDISQEAETLQSKINDLSDTSLGLSDAQFKFRTEILGAFKEIENSVDPVNTKVEKLGWLIKRVEEHQAAGGGVQDVLEVLVEGYDKLTAKVRAYEEELAKVSVVALETFNKLSDIESVNIALGISGEATLEEQIKVLEKALSDLSAKALEAIQNGEELDDVYIVAYTNIADKLKEKQRELISFYEQSSKTIADKFSGLTLENAIDVSDIIDVESAKAQYNELKNIYDDLKEYIESFNNLSISLSTDKTLNFGAFGDSIEVSANKVDTIRSSLEEVIESIKTLKNAGLEVPPVFTQMYEELKKLFYIESLNDIFIRLAESIKAIKDEFASATTYAQNFISVLEGKGVSSFESQYEKSKDELLSYAEAIDEVIQLKQKYIESGGKEASVLQNFSTQIIELNNQMQHQTGIVKSYYEELELYRTSIKGILSEKIGGTTEFNIKTNVSKALNELTIEISKINEISLVLGDTQEEAAEKIISAYSATVEELTKYKVELELLGKDASIVSDIISSLTDDLNKQASAIRKTVNALDEVRKEIGIIREVGEITGKSLSEVESSVTSALESKINALVASKGEGTKTAEEIEEINKQIKELEVEYNKSTAAKEYYEKQQEYINKFEEDISSLKNSFIDLNSSFSAIQLERENLGLSDIEALDKSIDAVKSKIADLNEMLTRHTEGSPLYKAISNQIKQLKQELEEMLKIKFYSEIQEAVDSASKKISIQTELSIIFNDDELSQLQSQISVVKNTLTELVEKKYEIQNMNISDEAKNEMLAEVQAAIDNIRLQFNELKQLEIKVKISVISDDFDEKIREIETYGDILGENIPQSKLQAAIGKLQELISLESETIRSNKENMKNFKKELDGTTKGVDALIEKISEFGEKLGGSFGEIAGSLKESMSSIYAEGSFGEIVINYENIEKAQKEIAELKGSLADGITAGIIENESSEELINFLEQLQAIIDRVEKVSGLQLRLDTSPIRNEINDTIQKINELKQELSNAKIKETLEDMGISLKVGSFADDLLKKTDIEKLQSTISSLESAFNSLKQAKIDALKEGLGTSKIDSEMSNLATKILGVKDELNKLEEAKKAAEEKAQKLAEALKKEAEEAAKLKESYDNLINNFKGNLDFNIHMKAVVDSSEIEIAELKLDSYIDKYRDLLTIIKDTGNLENALKILNLTGYEKENAISKLPKQAKEAFKELDKTMSKIKELKQLLINLKVSKIIIDIELKQNIAKDLSKLLGKSVDATEAIISDLEGALNELIQLKYEAIEKGLDTTKIVEDIEKVTNKIKELKDTQAEAMTVESVEKQLETYEELGFSELELADKRVEAYNIAISKLEEYIDELIIAGETTRSEVQAMVDELHRLKEEKDKAEEEKEKAEEEEKEKAEEEQSSSDQTFDEWMAERTAAIIAQIAAYKKQIAIYLNELQNLYNIFDSAFKAPENLETLLGITPSTEDKISGVVSAIYELKKADPLNYAPEVKTELLNKLMDELKKLYENKYKEIIDNFEKENARAAESFEAFGDVSAYVDQQLNNVVSAIEEMIELKETIDLSPNLEWTQENEDAYQGLIKTYNELKAIGEVTKGLSAAFNDAINSFADELMSGTSLDTALSGFRKNLRDSVRNAVVQALVSAVIIQSGLAKKLEQVGKAVGTAIADGIINWEEEDLINLLLDDLISDADEITDVLEEALSNLGWISDDIDDVQDIIDEIEPVQLFDVSIIKSDLSSVFSEFSENIKTMSFETAWGKASKSFKEKLKSSIINALIESAIEAGALKSKMEKLGLMVGEALKDGIITAAEQANIDLLTESLLSDAENVAEVIANLVDSFDKANKKNNLPALPPITNELSGNRNMDYIPVSDSSITEPIIDQVGIFVGEINNLKIYLSENTAAIQELAVFSEDVVTAKKRNRKEHVGDTYLPDGTPVHLYGNPEFAGGNSGSEGSGVSSDDVLKSLNNYLSFNLNLANSLISRVSETNSILKGAGSASKTENQYYTITIDSGAIVVNSTVQDTEELAETVMDKMKDRMEWEIRTAGGRI